jgi:hypothetical protein
VAYYDALIAEWATLTPGTTAQKLTQINNLKVAGSIPTTLYVTGSQILNCINWTEFAALTPAQQLNVLTLCSIQGSLLGGSANTSFVVDGMIIAYFPLQGSTIAALTALAKASTVYWWQSAGYPVMINTDMLAAAGLS